jgi:TolB-like protein
MSLLAEFRRRNVFRVAVVYAATAFVVLQAAELALPRLGVPDWALTLILVLVICGFPIALVLAWALELTPQGIRRSQVSATDEPSPPLLGKGTLLLTGALVVLGVGLAAGWLLQPAPGPSAMPPRADEQGASMRSIAVLPFSDLSAAGDQQYFADGLAEEILNLLAGIKELRVTGRTSSFSFRGKDVPIPEIGRSLGVAHVLDGSVRMAGERLRVTAQLIEAGTGFQLWSETFERRAQDIFVIQDEIAGAIARALEVSLVGQAASTDLEVYDLYLQARALIHQRRPEGLEQARAIIDRALALDPEYPPALSTSAELLLLMRSGSGTYGNLPVDQAKAEARMLLERALALDPQLVDAHAAMGLLAAGPGARSHLLRALALNPSHANANLWLSNWHADRGQVNASIDIRRRLADIDPLFAVNLNNLALELVDAGEVAEAAAIGRRLEQDFPGQPWANVVAGYVALMQGRLAQTVAEFERVHALAPGFGLTRFLAELTAYALGDFGGSTAESLGYLSTVGPIARGDLEKGLAEGRARVRVEPDNRIVAIGWLDGLSLAGWHWEVLQWVEERGQGIAGVEAYFPPSTGQGRYLLPIAAAQRAEGRDDEFAAMLEHIGARTAYLRENGGNNPWLSFVEASHAALGGAREEALAAIAAAIDSGLRDPLLLDWPAFAPFREDPQFRAQFARMIELINVERRALGMAPLS